MQILKSEALTADDLTVMLFERMITLLKRPNGWIQGQMCATADGASCNDVFSSEASCFCLIGARHRALHDVYHAQFKLPEEDAWKVVPHLHDAFINLYHSIEDACDGHSVEWNDTPNRTQEQVVAKVEQSFAHWTANHAVHTA